MGSIIAATTNPEFQFSPLREGRLLRKEEYTQVCYFNSRPCERGDASRVAQFGKHRNFNSRPCERGDFRQRKPVCYVCISILAPARGATKFAVRSITGSIISILAPARGATAKIAKSQLLFLLYFTKKLSLLKNPYAYMYQKPLFSCK